MKTFAAALIAATILSGPAMAQGYPSAPGTADGDEWITGTPPHLYKRQNGKTIDIGQITVDAGQWAGTQTESYTPAGIPVRSGEILAELVKIQAVLLQIYNHQIEMDARK